MSAATCENCLFWHPQRGKPYEHCDGVCRRYAPQGPVVKPDSAGWQLFPPMNSNQWCGDYRPGHQVITPSAASAAA